MKKKKKKKENKKTKALDDYKSVAQGPKWPGN
jgi:hypothetical protein